MTHPCGPAWERAGLPDRERNMRIGLKYCGGCNPNYERSGIVKRARAEYPRAEFTPYDKAGYYDLVLVICGCLEECFTFACANSRHGAILVRAPEEYRRLQAFMEAVGERAKTTS